jgi:hypothetical protein
LIRRRICACGSRAREKTQSLFQVGLTSMGKSTKVVPRKNTTMGNEHSIKAVAASPPIQAESWNPPASASRSGPSTVHDEVPSKRFSSPLTVAEKRIVTPTRTAIERELSGFVRNMLWPKYKVPMLFREKIKLSLLKRLKYFGFKKEEAHTYFHANSKNLFTTLS